MLYRMEIRVIFARKLVIKRGNVGNSKNGKRKIQTGSQGETLETPVVTPPAPQSHVIIAGKKVIYLENVGGERRQQGRRGGSGPGGGQMAEMAEMARSLAAVQEVLKKLVPEAVFP